jgi:hypothetical protein
MRKLLLSRNGTNLTAADWGALTDARISIVKAALLLTPEQEKILASRRGCNPRQGEEPGSSYCKHGKTDGRTA